MKVLIIDEAHPVLLELLNSHELDYTPSISIEKLDEIIPDYEILIMRSKLIFDKSWIDKSINLKFIGRLGSGMDNIDVSYAEKKGIKCFNAPEGNRVAVAEQTIGMMLSILAKVQKSALELKALSWNRTHNSGRELASMTVGIIGYGNVGEALAERLRCFGCKILAYDLYKSNFGSSCVEEVELSKLQDEADIVSLHIPLNSASDHMINQQFVERMKKPFYLFNLSRGDVVETSALIKGLEEGKILGLGLDVFENEKIDTFTDKQQLMFNKLQAMSNVIFTPHIGGLTTESYKKIAIVLAQKLNVEIK